MLPTTDVTDPAYRASGALQRLDYLRWGARKALRQSETAPSLLTPRLRPLFSAAAAIGEVDSGHIRLEITAAASIPIDLDEIPIPPSTLAVRLHGVEESDQFLLVGSTDGLRCVLGGSIEGAPCDPDEYVLSGDATFEPGDNYGQELDGTQTFVIAAVTQPVFVLSHNSPPEVIGGFDGAAAVAAEGGLLLPIGGSLADDLRDLVAPSPFQCGRTANACPGLPADLVVPLESEITEDNDPYENSWKHYLDLADGMAREADALGEDLVRAGLELDQRGEAARDGLEAVCGGVVNVADVFDSAENGGGTPEELISDAAQLHDPSLLGCLPAADKSDLEPWVTLGSEDLCAWRYKALPPCVCPPAIGSCGGRCPVPRGEGDCALPPEIVGDPDFELIPGGGVVRALGLLPPPRESPSDVSCAELGVLRDPDGPRDANARADLARVLQKQDWMRPRVLRQLVSAATYDEDWRDGLALSVYGAGVFSTAGSNNLPPCSEPVGGDATRATAPALFPLSDDDVCAFTAGRAERRRWIADMRRAFGTLGLISGALDGNMTRSWAVANSGDCSDKLEDPGQQICGWAPGPQSCGQLEQGCRSLSDADLDDPDGVNTAYGNVVWPAARFDHTVELELADGASTALNRLWGLSVPSAGESSIPTTLTSPHEHASFSFNWAGIFFRPEQEDRGIFYMPPRDSFLDPADDAIAADFASLTHEDVLDALALGCYLAATQGGGCETFNPTDVPVIRDARDLRHLEQHLLCAADGILTSAGRSLLASVPVVVASSVGSGQPLSLYPGYRGELLNALVALQTDLEQAALTSNAIQGQVRQAAYATSLARQQLEISDIHGQLAQLQTLAQMLATVTNALTTAVQSLGVGSVAAAGAAGQLVLLDQMGTLEAQLTELEQGTILTQYAQQTGDIMAELTRLGSDLRETVFRLNSDLARIESLRNSAMSLAARAAFMDRDEAGRLFPVTSVMRRRYNTARIRYERARDRARQMAFIARRAIEQRFGVDLEQMNDDLTLVDAPSGWANEVCTFEGIDYARIRQAQVDEQVPEEERVPENFADGYLGEYVQKLRLFVETYPFDFPFQDGSDLAVVSLRDDIFRARRECEVEVPNLVASSEQLSGTDGEDPAAAPWRVEGCAEGDAGLLPCLHLATQQGLVLADRMANRTADNDISMPEATGRLVQEIEITRTPVDLLASWTDRFFAPADAAALGAEDLGVDAPIPYRVTLERVGGAPEERVDETFALLDDDQPHANQLGVLTVLAPGTIRLTIDPSADDLVRGDVWLAELQVEVLEPGEDPIPSAYMPTVRSGFSIQAVCPDLEGEALRDRYFADREERVCPSGLGRDCDEDGGNVLRTESFHEALFGLGLEQIERGEIIPSAQIALGNYNYRHDLIAVNLVGTNVRDCSRSDEPATCYSNAFVPFTLVHEGDDIPVRNHDGETVPFDFERAFIEHGKALSSEVVLTNPLTGSAETLLGSYYKQEFRGRPLAGHYTLRIWDDPALNWQNVEDVQLVFRYRYWTRFER